MPLRLRSLTRAMQGKNMCPCFGQPGPGATWDFYGKVLPIKWASTHTIICPLCSQMIRIVAANPLPDGERRPESDMDWRIPMHRLPSSVSTAL
jgi:hypothetical protein